MKKIIGILTLSFILALPSYAQNFLEKKVVKLNEGVPDFELADLEGNKHTLSAQKGKVVMLHFWSATCPFVVRYEEQLQQITADYKDKGVVVYGIDSNSNETADQIKKVAAERKINYPILLDSGNKVADQFGAITTPHVYILDQEGKLQYEGAVDDQGWSEAKKISHYYVRESLDQVLGGQPVINPQTKTVGCTVKRA